MYKKAAVVVPVFTASLVSSKAEPSKDDLSSNGSPAVTKSQSPKQPKKHEICFGDPKIRSLHLTRQSRSRIKKSRSTLSILRLKSSYLRSRYLKSHNLRLCVSKSSDLRYFTSRSPTLSPSTSCSNSPRTGSPGSGSTYTVSDLKSVHSTPSGHRSPNSVSVCLSVTSLSSTSPFSESPASRPTYSTSHFYHTRSPVSKQHCRVASKLTASEPSCLKDPKSRSCGSKSPVSKPCLRSPAATFLSSKSPESRPPCLKSDLKSSRSRPQAPQKSCLRSPTSKSPENKPSCFRTPTSKSLNSKPSPLKRSCLKSPVLTSLSKKSSGTKSRCNHLETSANKSPKPATSPTLRLSTSPQSRSPKSRSPCPKSVSFKSADTKSLKSRSPVSMYSPPRTPKSTSTCSKPQFKDADSRSVQSRSPQRHLPGLVSPALRSHFLKPQYLRAPNNEKPRLGSPPPPNPTDSKCPRQRFPYPKDANLASNKPENLKRPDPKRRPRLAVSKIHVSRLSVKRSRGLRRPNLKTHDQVRKPSKSLVKLSDSKSVGQVSRSRLANLTMKDLNREYLEKLLATKMDVCYMLELKSYIEKIKSSFVLHNMHPCDSSECPVLQERLRSHRLQHHDGQHPAETPGGNPGETKGNEAQTKITLADLGGFSIDLKAHPTSTNAAPNFYGRDVNDTGYKGKSANDGESNDQWEPTYNEPRSYGGGPEYDAGLDNQGLPGYEGVPVSLAPPGYEGRPRNQGRSYKAGPDYEQGPGYQEAPVYQEQPGYKVEPGYKQEPSYEKGSDQEGGERSNKPNPGFKQSSAYERGPSEIAQIYGNKTGPGFKQESGNKQIPNERGPGHEQAHDDKGRIGFLLEPDIKREIDDKSASPDKHGIGYEEKLGDEKTISDKRDLVYKQEHGYKRRPSFEQEHGVVVGPGGRRVTRDPRGPGYKQDPKYERGSNYGQRPITGQGPVSERVQSDKDNSGYVQFRKPSYLLNRTVDNSNSALNATKTLNNSQNYDRQNSNYLSNNQVCKDPKCSARTNTSGHLNDTTYNLSYGSNQHVCAPSGSDAYYPHKRCKQKHGDELLPSCVNVTSFCSDTALKYTAISKNICGCPTVKNIVKHKPSCGIRLNNVEREISDWLTKCTFSKCNGLTNRKEMIDAILFYINPYLNQSSKSLNKAILKAKIMKILKALKICGHTSGGMKMALSKQADDLANRLIGIVTRLEFTRNIRWNCCVRADRPFRFAEQVLVGPNKVNREDLKHDLMQEFEYSLRNLNIENTKEVLEDVTELIIDKIELLRRDIDEIVRNDIRAILENSKSLTDDEITNTVNGIIKSAREIVKMIINVNDRTNNTITARTCLSGSGTISIYTSEHEAPSFAAAGTSSPKKKKEILKLGPEEKAYNDEIVSVVRDWIKTKPNPFKNLNDNKMNELMIHDLAGEIVDHVKLGQLIPDPTIDTKSIMTYYIYKWLRKFEILDDLEQAEPYIQELVKQIQAISVPQMTRSQYGTRQTLKNIKHIGAKLEGWNETYFPEAQDILEDEVSIWMNEYPSDIFVTKDKSVQNKLVHELAEKLQNDESDKISDEDVAKHVKIWLKKVVKSREKERIDGMFESLRERISKVPHDKTLAAKIKEKQDEKMEYMRDSSEPIPESLGNITEEENDNTMKEFIIKYVKHNYDDDDPLTKGAYVKLLKLELQRLSPQVLKEVYEGQPLGKFSPEKLFRELGYIKDISDWLKTLPVDPHYHSVENKRRLDFIISLAREIAHLEEERRETPDAMNYDECIGHVICEYMHQLPLKLKIGDSITKYVNPILINIFGKRELITPPLPYQVWENIAVFIDDFVRLNGQDIADDENKLEVWATRLVQEIKKMIAENPSSLPAADVRDRLAGVAKPGDETIERFNHELDYAKEISDWLKNFSLKTNVDDEIIKDLAEKMAEYDNKTDNSELVKYIKQWISSLPLNENKQIDLRLVTQQLLNRRTKVLKPNDPIILPVLSDSKSSGSVLKPRDGGSIKSECRGCCPVDDPGLIIVQVIKDWCDELPLQGTEEDFKHARDNIASKLFQKIIEINDDPRLVRNEMLYMDALSDKIDELLENFQQNVKLEGDEIKLKSKLLKKIRQARLFTREVSLGDEYIKDLEDAIETALPKPASTAGADPGFELYKQNLAEMFILENFDYGDDADKLKHKKKIKEKIYEFYPYAQIRSSVPADKLYNYILGVLFHVSMPIEKAMIDNVEEIKTKCEIDDWFEKLPLLLVKGPAEQVERNQRIRLLARKLHILGFEKDADQKIHKEITKWLTNMPLTPGENTNIDRFANDLQEILKETQKSRKCVTAADVIPPTAREENSMWVNPNTTIDTQNAQDSARLKTGDIIIDIVEKWCDNISFPAQLPKVQTKRMKDDVTIQIIKKISELNSGRNTFDDDTLYNHLLSQEIDKALASLPQNDTLTQSKGALKHQLVSAIDSVKPLIREDRARHLYKTELENTVASLLGALENATPEEQVMFSKIQEEIVDDFLEHQYNKDDDEGKEFYKKKMINALIKYNIIGENYENRVEVISDSLVEANRMLCELQKIIPPENLALKDEVEEIRMKQAVDNFLKKVSPTSHHKSIRRNSLKDSLARQLHEMEKRGHTEDTNQKMAAAVSRTLKKLNAEDKDDEVKPFIDRLQKNESIRKAPPYKKGNFSFPTDFHESRGQHFDKAPFAQSWPVPPNMYESEYQKSFGPSNTRSKVGPSVQRLPVPISPTKVLKDFMGYPPQHSITIDSLDGKHQEVEVSVYRRDYVPPNWAPPTPPHQHYQEVVFPDRLPIQQTLTQPTQTPTYRPGATQTPSVPSTALPHTLQVPEGYGRPQVGNYNQTQAENYGQPQIGNYNQPVRSFGRARVDNFGQPQASNAGVQSGPGYVPAAGELELTGDECLCDMCMKNPCEFVDYFDSCDSGLVPIFRRQMMLPPCPLMPPPYMY